MKKTITIDISKEFLEKGTLRFSAQTKKGKDIFRSLFGWGISSVDIDPYWEDCFEDELTKQAPHFDDITIYKIGD
tara:strand:- start:500 stop:724 length:225 start_codon:yes stop_codon:yes gene_type:complete